MPQSAPALPPGLRLYAIGDIHGRLDLLDNLLAKIEADRTSATGEVQTIFLGDYVDRGLFSRQVIDRLIGLKLAPGKIPIFLMGNHEKVMRDIVRSPDESASQDGISLEDWLRFGGRETLMSYGVPPPMLPSGFPATIAQLKAKMPVTHLEFLDHLVTSVSFGDYFFCHAGVRPGVELSKQSDQDLVWIRYDFLSHKGFLGKVIVHGHTISPEVEILSNRIGVDTGAYATGCLSCLALEGTKQWLLQTK